MNLTQLRALNEIARQKSFTRAATALGQSQPAISKTIRSLETEVGEPLFIRGTDAVALTSFGEQLHAHASTILGEFQALRTLISDRRGLKQGTLRIGVPPSLSGWPTAKLVSSFRRRHPSVGCRVFEGDAGELTSWIGENTVDVALFTRSLGSWNWTPIIDEPFVAIVSRPAGLNKIVTLDFLATQSLISSSCGIGDVLERFFASNGLVFEPQILTRSYSTIFAMVEEGLGSSILPQSVAELAGSGVVVKGIKDGPVRTLGIVTPKSSGQIVEAFVAEARALLPSIIATTSESAEQSS